VAAWLDSGGAVGVWRAAGLDVLVGLVMRGRLVVSDSARGGVAVSDARRGGASATDAGRGGLTVADE
jgi:hypothetical protein